MNPSPALHETAVRWGLGEEPTDDGPGPPRGWTEVQWMTESRRALNAWIKTAEDHQIEALAEHGELPEGVPGFRVEPETLAAAVHSALGRLRRRQWMNTLREVYEAARSAPGRWHSFPYLLDEQNARMLREMAARKRGVSARVRQEDPGSDLFRLSLYVISDNYPFYVTPDN